MSAITHSPGFFDFIGDIGRAIAPLATVVAPFFPPAAAVAGLAGVAAAAFPRGGEAPRPPAVLVQGPSQAIGTSFPSVPAAAALEGEEPDVESFTEEEELEEEAAAG